MASDKPEEPEIEEQKNQSEQKEEKKPTDYRTDLLQTVFQRLSKESYPKVLQEFYDVLLPGQKADSKAECYVYVIDVFSSNAQGFHNNVYQDKDGIISNIHNI